MKLDVDALKDGVIVADGAWSVQLQASGLPPGVMPETANVTHPDLVVALAREYLAAGARFLTTNTFAANRLMLERRGVRHTVREVNRLGAELARRAATEHDAWAVGSIGPSGKILAVREVNEKQLTALFEEQAEALAAGGVDAIVLETFSEPAEALLALRVVKRATGLPVIACMSYDSGPQRTRTLMGAEASACAAALEDAGADIIGCNCGGGVERALPAVVALRAAGARPLWVKPNAGLPDLEGGRPVYKQTPEDFAARFPTLIAAGANIVGGCCGAGPGHIRRLAALVEARRRAGRKTAAD